MSPTQRAVLIVALLAALFTILRFVSMGTNQRDTTFTTANMVKSQFADAVSYLKKRMDEIRSSFNTTHTNGSSITNKITTGRRPNKPNSQPTTTETSRQTKPVKTKQVKALQLIDDAVSDVKKRMDEIRSSFNTTHTNGSSITNKITTSRRPNKPNSQPTTTDTSRHTKPVKPKQKSQATPECWESPFVDCGADPVGYVINTSYKQRFGAFPPVKLTPSVDHPPPGLTVATRPIDHLNVAINTSKVYRVSLLNKQGWTKHLNFAGCEFSNCKYTNTMHDSSVDLMIANAVDHSGGWTPPAVNSHQMLAMYAMESGGLGVHRRKIITTPTAWSHLFNITINYRVDADIFAPYGALKFALPDPTRNLVQIASQKNKTVIWLVSHCPVPSKRREYVKEMQKYINVDIYGRCGPLKCPKRNTKPDVCGPDMSQYQFYLSFENTFCKDYITEKFFKIFLPGNTVIPVARGGADYDSYFEPGSFINAAHFKSAKDLALHLKFLSENVNEYVKVLEKKLKYTANPKINLNSYHCDVCKLLNKRDKRLTTQYDIVKWYGQPPFYAGH